MMQREEGKGGGGGGGALLCHIYREINNEKLVPLKVGDKCHSVAYLCNVFHSLFGLVVQRLGRVGEGGAEREERDRD